MQTFSLNLDCAPTAKSVGKSGATTWSFEDTRDSDSVELVGDWDPSYTKTMEKIHKVTMSKQSSDANEDKSCGEKKDEETDQENQEEEEDNYGDTDDGTLKTKKNLRANLLWAPMIQKKTRSRIQDITDDAEQEGQELQEEEEEDSESDGLFGLQFYSDDDSDNAGEDNEEEQDDGLEDHNSQSTKRVLVFDEWEHDLIVGIIL